MGKYVVIHGSVKTGTGPEALHVPRTKAIELDEKVAKPLLESGTIVKAEEWDAAKKVAIANAELEAARKKLGENKPLSKTLLEAIEAEKQDQLAQLAAAEASKGAEKPASKVADKK